MGLQQRKWGSVDLKGDTGKESDCQMSLPQPGKLSNELVVR